MIPSSKLVHRCSISCLERRWERQDSRSQPHGHAAHCCRFARWTWIARVRWWCRSATKTIHVDLLPTQCSQCAERQPPQFSDDAGSPPAGAVALVFTGDSPSQRSYSVTARGEGQAQVGLPCASRRRSIQPESSARCDTEYCSSRPWSAPTHAGCPRALHRWSTLRHSPCTSFLMQRAPLACGVFAAARGTLFEKRWNLVPSQ